jgi:hypothetical protein
MGPRSGLNTSNWWIIRKRCQLSSQSVEPTRGVSSRGAVFLQRRFRRGVQESVAVPGRTGRLSVQKTALSCHMSVRDKWPPHLLFENQRRSAHEERWVDFMYLWVYLFSQPTSRLSAQYLFIVHLTRISVSFVTHNMVHESLRGTKSKWLCSRGPSSLLQDRGVISSAWKKQ